MALPWCTTLDVRRGPSSPLRLFGDQQAEIGRVFPRVCHVGQVKGILGLGTVPCEPSKPLKLAFPRWAANPLTVESKIAQPTGSAKYRNASSGDQTA